MSESSKIDKELYIHKFLSGAMSPQERISFLEWLDESNENRKVYEELNSIWNASQAIPGMQRFDYKAAFEKHKSRLNEQAEITERKPRIFTLYRRYFVAAAALLGLVLATLFLLKKDKTLETYYAENSPENIVLPDQSEVWLQKGANLIIRQYDNTERKVELTGIAFFDVSKSSDKTFTVLASEMEVKVLGTSFIVDSDKKYVWLKTGKVQLISGNKSVQLTPGQSAYLVSGKFTIESSPSMDTTKFDWINKEFSFNNAPLNKVIRDIELRFGISIVLGENEDISACYFTSGSLRSNTLDEVFNILKLSFNMKVDSLDAHKYRMTDISCR
ncbi:MAG: FecR family protein [Saprospiraceae bacterium]|nr:FecR family protein [Saprospiraceae bacterium]